jgi:ABC-type nickel/cobalt efflux system permease component RcnA
MRKTAYFLLFFLLATPWAATHPVPRRVHDRTIRVHLVARQDIISVRVEYRLDVDPFTVLFDDLPAIADPADLKKLHQQIEFYDAFMAAYAPIFARNLIAEIDGREVALHCQSRSFTGRDEQGKELGHLRCEFVFFGEVPRSANEPPSHRFQFRETNYELEEGKIDLDLSAGDGIRLNALTAPDVALKNRAVTELKPGDDARLRRASAEFELTTSDSSAPAISSNALTESSGAGLEQPHSLLALLLDSQAGFWILLCWAAGFGAAHALTPGHGKTLVAAYLVGERGTAAHAFFLGLVTTITHTGAVLFLALALRWFFPQAVPREVQVVLGLAGGLLVAGLGLWLLLRRLTGGADHFHLGGGHHHHHGHTHESEPPMQTSEPVGWWQLALLGLSGGIVPCWDAIIMLGWAIASQRLWLGVPLLIAFSAGLASVLIAIGLVVVYAKGFASAHWGASRIIRSLPILSAGLVTIMGLWLCYDTMHHGQ